MSLLYVLIYIVLLQSFFWLAIQDIDPNLLSRASELLLA